MTAASHMALLASGGATPNRALIDIITDLGLTSGLRVCLDAGDENSYSSGQVWNDTSGNNEDWYRGSSSSSQSSDPTFNGTAGNLSANEYFSVDGGDFFKYAGASIPTWMQNFHKNNAVFTVLAWVWSPTGGAKDYYVFSTGQATDPEGVVFQINKSTDSPAGALLLFGFDEASSQIIAQSSAGGISFATWSCVGVAINEATGAGGLTWFIDGASETDTSTYTSPSAGGVSSAWIGASDASGSSPPDTKSPSGSRIAAIAIWSTQLTATQMNSIYEASRERFGV